MPAAVKTRDVCRWIVADLLNGLIRIRDDVYELSQAPAYARTFRLAKRGGNEVHDVCVAEGRESCSCADFRMRHIKSVQAGGAGCKHVRAIKALLTAKGW